MKLHSRKLLLQLAWGTAAMLVAVHVGSLMLLESRLPEALGSHWDLGGTADATGSLPQTVWGGVAAIVVLCGMATLGLVPPSRGKQEAGPLLLGVCTGSAVVATGMMLAGTWGQLDSASGVGSPMHVPTSIGALVAGVAWGIGSAMLLNASAPDAPRPARSDSATGTDPRN